MCVSITLQFLNTLFYIDSVSLFQSDEARVWSPNPYSPTYPLSTKTIPALQQRRKFQSNPASVTAPTLLEETNLAYLANTPLVYRGVGGSHT